MKKFSLSLVVIFFSFSLLADVLQVDPIRGVNSFDSCAASGTEYDILYLVPYHESIGLGPDGKSVLKVISNGNESIELLNSISEVKVVGDIEKSQCYSRRINGRNNDVSGDLDHYYLTSYPAKYQIQVTTTDGENFFAECNRKTTIIRADDSCNQI